MNQELIQYVQNEFAHGVSPENVKAALVARGYTEAQATEVIRTAQTVTPETIGLYAPPAKTSWVKILLIVLAVIFVPILVLGSIVLASLNNARDKGEDAAVKATINNTRAQGEIHYDSNGGSYAGFCNDPIIRSQYGTIDCEDNDTGFRTSAELNDGSYYCADSTGFVGSFSSRPTGSACE